MKAEWYTEKGSDLVMKMHSSFQNDENVYFELDYIEGCTLFSQVIARNQAVIDNAAFYAAEIIVGLQYLHKYNIVYRELQPENIMIDANKENKGHVKLIDFGNSKMLAANERTSTACGPAVYMPPEMLAGEAYNHSVDVWALGVLICEVISGQTPFQAATTMQVYENIVTNQAKFHWGADLAELRKSVVVRSLLDAIFVADV